MSGTAWLVVAAGIAAIAWVNWYFLVAPRHAETGVARSVARGVAGGIPEVRIVVRGGYEPATVRVPAGQPVRLVFDRQETSSCSEEIVFPSFAIRRFLPAGEQTTVEITPPAPGRYEFTCGMAMLHGAVIAEA